MSDADGRDNIMEVGLTRFKEFRYLVEKDIGNEVDEFGKCAQQMGEIVFRICQTSQEGYGCLGSGLFWPSSDIPNHEHFNEEALFEALIMAQIFKADIVLLQVIVNSEVDDHKKFKDKQIGLSGRNCLYLSGVCNSQI